MTSPPGSELPRIQRLLAQLRLPASAALPLHQLSQHAPAEPVRLPDGAELAAVLDRLQLDPKDRAELVTARPDPDDHPGPWWLLERCVGLLRERQGTIGALPPWPDLPEQLGPVGRFLYVWAFLGALSAVRTYHRSRGIPDDLSWRALGTIALQLRNRRLRYGAGGLHTQNWVTHHFRGAIYALGRLHFERTLITFDPGSDDAPPAGAPALGVHIPEGRLTPESCDAALDQARAFFARHFADEPYRFATCSSWVLDPQLRRYLAPDSNIIRFQERFTLIPELGPDSNETVVEFIFKRPYDHLAVLPRTTSLQRGVLEHIESGGTWRFRTGWFRL